MGTFFTVLSLGLFIGFIVWLILEARRAPTIPSDQDPDYYPYLNDPLDPRD